MYPIRVISLKRSTDRRAAFAQNNPQLRYSYYDAVDGAQLTAVQRADPKLFRPGLPYTFGAYGGALSHTNLWLEAITSNQPVTVLEDDAIVRGDFQQMHDDLLDQLADGWDIVLWGWNFDSKLIVNPMPNVTAMSITGDQKLLRTSVPGFQAMTSMPNLLPLISCFGIPGYTISAAGARKFRDQCLPLCNFRLTLPFYPEPFSNTGIDSAMNGVYHATKAFACFPPLVITRNEREKSTIQNDQFPPPLV